MAPVPPGRSKWWRVGGLKRGRTGSHRDRTHPAERDPILIEKNVAPVYAFWYSQKNRHMCFSTIQKEETK
jgi:hypothetical protein